MENISITNGQSGNFRWLLKMAWRDSRRSKSKLFLFISSIILGIAALVAIYSFGNNLRRDIDNQAATLIGADLVLSTNKALNEKAQAFLGTFKAERSREVSFASMVLFTKNQGTRLIQVRALEGRFPYYGAIETTPVSAARDFRSRQEAVVDKTLLMQFGAEPGDSIKVGEMTFKIAGILNKTPGQTGLSASMAPIVYIPYQYLDQTGLMQKGSRINYKFYYKFANSVDVEKLVKRLEPEIEKHGLNHETIESQKQETGRYFQDLTQFLSLVGFVALLLGCIGVASAIHIYVREKLPSIAILRCMGVKAIQAFQIYLIQIVGIGLLGSVIGAVIGTLIQQILPLVLADILPVEISVSLSWTAIIQGVVLGVVISLLFALLPLISVRNISPLNTLRISFQETSFFRDPLKWVVYLLILLFVIIFAYYQLDNWMRAFLFTGAVVIAFLTLSLMAWLLVSLVRRYFPSSWSYLWRQGLANLFRPNNQTLILVVAIGLGTAFISTLFFVQDILLQRVTLSASGNQPNMVLFDIQSNQREEVKKLTLEHNLPVLQQVPIVTMRVEEIKGYTAAEVRNDTTIKISSNSFNSELRTTFRDSLISSEEITDGKWIGTVLPNGTVNVSLEEGYARRLKVDVGDEMVFNVQGALVPAVVGSIRKVDWQRVQTNFRVVFPAGVLEDAPQFHVIITKVPSKEASASFQQAVVGRFPNISIIDLDLILSVLDDILNKIAFVIQFMGAFSIITGVIVLIASVLISKFQRIQESVLLRTMGASRKQIFYISAIEYFFLGALAAATGIILALAGSWGLAEFNFETSFTPQVLPILYLFISISLLTVIVGLLNSRGILNKAPLEVLRKDV